MESRGVTVSDLKVHARVWISQHPLARRVPVVLVHGLVVSILYMIPTAERLTAYYQVWLWVVSRKLFQGKGSH
jgi:hypothetical protein